MIYRESPAMLPSTSPKHQRVISELEDLCTAEALDDDFARAGPGFYEEATIDLSRQNGGSSYAMCYGADLVQRKCQSLLDPDCRVGAPFL